MCVLRPAPPRAQPHPPGLLVCCTRVIANHTNFQLFRIYFTWMSHFCLIWLSYMRIIFFKILTDNLTCKNKLKRTYHVNASYLKYSRMQWPYWCELKYSILPQDGVVGRVKEKWPNQQLQPMSSYGLVFAGCQSTQVQLEDSDWLLYLPLLAEMNLECNNDNRVLRNTLGKFSCI